MSEYKDLNVENIDKKLYKKLFFKKINNIVINGVKYRFKPVPKDSKGEYDLGCYYSSLIIKNICDVVNIDCCEVFLKRLKGKLIILMPDYRKENCNYISGQDLLDEYVHCIEKLKLVSDYSDLTPDEIKDNYYRDVLISDMNNLETIWDALNYHYRNDEKFKREDKVTSIMVEFVKRFCLDFLVMQEDRHVSNWEIEENNSDAHLVPMYDNDSIFRYENYNPSIKVDLNSFFSKENQLELFLEKSSDYFKKEFLNMYNILTPQKITEIINEIEQKEKMQIPYIYKTKLLENYTKNYENIKEILIRLNITEGGLKQ